jgi:hypothetical protein
MHYARWERHGDVHMVKRPPGQPGSSNPRWKGDDAGYYTVHHRLSRYRGRPSRCDHCGHSDPDAAYHWALDWSRQPTTTTEDGLPYSTDLNDYVRLCVPCHKRMDLAQPA